MTQPALTPAQVLAIVSDLARDRSVVDVAARHHVAADVVAMVRADFGPGLGQLAKAAEKLLAAIRSARTHRDVLRRLLFAVQTYLDAEAGA